MSPWMLQTQDEAAGHPALAAHTTASRPCSRAGAGKLWLRGRVCGPDGAAGRQLRHARPHRRRAGEMSPRGTQGLSSGGGVKTWAPILTPAASLPQDQRSLNSRVAGRLPSPPAQPRAACVRHALASSKKFVSRFMTQYDTIFSIRIDKCRSHV